MSEPHERPTATRRDVLAGAAAGLATAATPALAPAAEATEWLNVRDFGAKGDGVTDDGPALIRMRDYMQRDRDKHYVCHFPTGRYLYSRNNWLAMVGSVQVDAWGCELRCISTSMAGADPWPLRSSDLWSNQGNFTSAEQPGDWRWSTGARFATAPAGATSLRLLEPAALPDFPVGMRVFIHGFDQQFYGFPPNLRFIQWNVVTGVRASDATLLLRDPLTSEYRQEWHDTISDRGLEYGAPRVLALVRPNNYYARLVSLNGFRILGHPAPNAENPLMVAADRLELRGVEHRSGEFWPAQTRDAIYEDCHFANVEGDKNGDRAVFRRCRFDALYYFTGFNEVEVTECTTGRPIDVCSRIVRFKRNQITLPPRWPYGGLATTGWNVSLLEAEGNTFRHDGALQYGVGTSNEFDVRVEGIGPQGQILLSPGAQGDLIRRMSIGTLLYSPDGSIHGKISRITWNGTMHVLEGTWPLLSVGQVLKAYSVQRVRVGENTFVGGERRLLNHPRAPQLSASGELVTIRFGRDLNPQAETVAYILGHLRRIRASVTRAYSGSSSSARLYVSVLNGVQAAVTFIDVSLRSEGTYETTTTTATASTSTTSIVRLDPALYCQRLVIGFFATPGSSDQMPLVDVEVDAVPLGA